MQEKRILLTGATGYVGSQLLKILEKRDDPVHCLTRNPQKLSDKVAATTHVFQGDVLEPETLKAAFEHVDTAFYLVHSLDASKDFEEKEQQGAQNFSSQAKASGIKRIIYLGGLVNEKGILSPHLKSRLAVGKIIRESGVPTIELRASIVIGAGSLSFEMIRSLTERLPVMITPKWVATLAQPIGIRDLLEYLIKSLDLPITESIVVEIGGRDQLSYRDLMAEYARQRGLKRFMIPVPVLSPRLSSLWLALVTPLYFRIGRKLIESLKYPTIVKDPLAKKLFDIKPASAAQAIREALDR